jgi:hypothetical protein
VPALAKSARAGHPQFLCGKEKARRKGRATRPDYELFPDDNYPHSKLADFHLSSDNSPEPFVVPLKFGQLQES